MTIAACISVPTEGFAADLFGMVAGLPLWQRQLLMLSRTGAAPIAILEQPDRKEKLRRELAAVQKLPPVRIISDPRELAHTSLNHEVEGCLYLPLNLLIEPERLAAFAAQDLPQGQVAVGIVSMSHATGADTGKLENRSPVLLSGDQVVSWGERESATTEQASRLLLFSTSAWQEWRNSGHDLDLFLTRLARQDRLRGIELHSGEVFFIRQQQDLESATNWLISREESSPVGEGILENSWNRALARRLLPWILRQQIAPNQITLTAFLFGLLATWAFAQGSHGWSVAAGLLLPLLLVLDCLDGAVARLKFKESRLGAWLDRQGDSLLNLLLFWGIARGCYLASSHPVFLVAGVLLTFGYLSCWWLLDMPGVVALPTAQAPESWKEKILAELSSRDFFYLILLLACLNRLEWLIVGSAVGTNIFAIVLFRQKYYGQG